MPPAHKKAASRSDGEPTTHEPTVGASQRRDNDAPQREHSYSEATTAHNSGSAAPTAAPTHATTTTTTSSGTASPLQPVRTQHTPTHPRPPLAQHSRPYSASDSHAPDSHMAATPTTMTTTKAAAANVTEASYSEPTRHYPPHHDNNNNNNSNNAYGHSHADPSVFAPAPDAHAPSRPTLVAAAATTAAGRTAQALPQLTTTTTPAATAAAAAHVATPVVPSLALAARAGTAGVTAGASDRSGSSSDLAQMTTHERAVARASSAGAGTNTTTTTTTTTTTDEELSKPPPSREDVAGATLSTTTAAGGAAAVGTTTTAPSSTSLATTSAMSPRTTVAAIAAATAAAAAAPAASPPPPHPLTAGDNQGDEPTPEAYDPTVKWWALALQNVFELVQLRDPLAGVESADAARHAQMLGNNVIPIKSGPRWWQILASQFMNAITVVLLIVIIISAVFRDWAEFAVVVFVLFFNAFLGFYQEFSAERSLESLKEMTAGVAKVLRDGQPEIIFIDEVVVGDVIILEQGASVPADCRVFESNGLEVDEALLTGEALPVVKHTNVIADPDGRLALGDRKNMVYRNTLVTSGRGKAVVTAGGLHTEMGKLASRLNDGKRAGKTKLMRTLDYMMYFLFACCIVLGVIVFAANKMRYTPSTLSYATAVAIAILPESLSAVITVAMTVSVKHMAKKKCIVRKLAVLEVLGNVTDICSDKTGTLTENKMVVKKAVIGTREVYLVTGAPYDVHGDFVAVSAGGVAGEPFNMAHHYPEHVYLYEFLRCAALCSTTVLHISDEDMDSLVGSGNPTEIAIQVMTWKAHLNRDDFQNEGWMCVTEYPFDSGIKRMSTAWHNETTGELYLCTKGAPERVLALCNYHIDPASGALQALTPADRAEVEQHISDLAAQGLRTICFAYRDRASEHFHMPPSTSPQTFGDVYSRDVVERDLVFLGLVGIYDPPRPESRPSVLACQGAGIRVRMLTGDHTTTAGSIASMLNIILRRDLHDTTKLQAGPDFDRTDFETIDTWPDLPYVIGRCSPESKVKMIEALHRRRRVVAMTGDGFNDSPSIKIADIGCAMGSGVDVTKGVADLVITDDNFSTIVKAVAEGRRISQCIRKFVVHLLSSNVAEVIALICGLPVRHEDSPLFILSPIEILWLNMCTSAPPATGLSLDVATKDVLQVPPNTAGFFTIELMADTFIYGFWLGVMTLMGFIVILYGFDSGPVGTDCNSHNGVGCYNIWQARCTAFGILYFGLLLHTYTVRHPRLSVLKMKWFDNRWIYGSVAVGSILFVPIVYINPIAHGLFVHHMITWHWGVLAIATLVFMGTSELYKVIKNAVFPIHRIHIEVDAEDAEELQQEYNNLTRTEHDDRPVTHIAEEHLRMSFASVAENISMAPTASFRMSMDGSHGRHRKKKHRLLFR